MASKISRNIGIIARLRHCIPFSTLQNLYRSLIFPYLSYGLVVWGQAAKTHLEKLLILQKRAVRLMNFANYSDHAIPLFFSSDILPLPMLHYKLLSILMLDVHNKLVPSNLLELFTSTRDVHHYNTRSSSSDNFFINYSRLNHHKNSFSFLGAKVWNSLPKSLRQLTKHKFKKTIEETLFQILITQDSYVDVSTLTDAMKKL